MASNAENVSIWWRHHDSAPNKALEDCMHICNPLDRLFQFQNVVCKNLIIYSYILIHFSDNVTPVMPRITTTIPYIAIRCFTLQIIEFVFTSFAMESTCSFDSLSVFDGESITAPSLGTYCGHSLPEPIYTTGRYAMLHFKTDGSIRYSGFSVGFTALDEQPMTTSANIETTSASSEGNIILRCQWVVAIWNSWQKLYANANLAKSPMASIPDVKSFANLVQS